MRKRGWMAALAMAAILGLACQSLGTKKAAGPAKGKRQDQILSCIRQRAWMAYLQGPKGALAPVRDTLNTDHDEDWIGLRFTDYDGPRIRLGVLKVLNKSAEGEDRLEPGRIEVPVAGIQEMLTVSLFNTKRFDVIEQKRIDEVLAQQKRKDVAEPSPTSIVNVGKVLGAQYLVYGTVNEWSPDRASQNMGAGRLLGLGKKEAEVAITFTLTDVANGQILFTTAERARIGEWSLSFEAYGGGGSTSQKTPVSYAVNACANKAAFKIARFLKDRRWKGSVVDIKRADFYINAGSQQGMAPQMQLSVLSVKGLVRDPESRTILGEDLRGIGTLEVVVVQTGFSIARVVQGCKGIKKGDRVELASNPVPPPRVPGCDEWDSGLAQGPS